MTHSEKISIHLIGTAKDEIYSYEDTIPYTEDTTLNDIQEKYDCVAIIIEKDTLNSENHYYHTIKCNKNLGLCKNTKIVDILDIIQKNPIEFYLTRKNIKNHEIKPWHQIKIKHHAFIKIDFNQEENTITTKISQNDIEKSITKEVHDTISDEILTDIILNSYKDTITEHEKIKLLKFYKHHPFRNDSLKHIDRIIQQNIHYKKSEKKHKHAIEKLCEILRKKFS